MVARYFGALSGELAVEEFQISVVVQLVDIWCAQLRDEPETLVHEVIFVVCVCMSKLCRHS